MKNIELRKVPNHSMYSVTRDGRVFTHKQRSGWITGATDKLGYKRLNATNDQGKRSNLYIHRAVAITYLPNPENKPHVNHRDNNPSNNNLSNLEWCTHAENIQHAGRQGRMSRGWGEDNAVHKYPTSLILKLRQLFDSGEYSQMELSRKFKLPFPTVHVIVRRKQWRNI